MVAPQKSSEIKGQSKSMGPNSFCVYVLSPVPGCPNYSKDKMIIRIKRLNLKASTYPLHISLPLLRRNHLIQSLAK